MCVLTLQAYENNTKVAHYRAQRILGLLLAPPRGIMYSASGLDLPEGNLERGASRYVGRACAAEGGSGGRQRASTSISARAKAEYACNDTCAVVRRGKTHPHPGAIPLRPLSLGLSLVVNGIEFQERAELVERRPWPEPPNWPKAKNMGPPSRRRKRHLDSRASEPRGRRKQTTPSVLMSLIIIEAVTSSRMALDKTTTTPSHLPPLRYAVNEHVFRFIVLGLSFFAFFALIPKLRTS